MLNFEKVEELFQDLIDEAYSVLTVSEVAEVQEYIDVGEYGLALSTAVAIYVEEHKIASARTLDLVSRLSLEMSDDPKPMLDQLAKVKSQ